MSVSMEPKSGDQRRRTLNFWEQKSKHVQIITTTTTVAYNHTSLAFIPPSTMLSQSQQLNKYAQITKPTAAAIKANEPSSVVVDTSAEEPRVTKHPPHLKFYH